MKHSLLFILALSAALISLFSCDDTTDTIGMSLTQKVDNVSISADSFFVESHSAAAEDIISRSSNGYLGSIKDPETNSYVTCNFMTQYRTMGEYAFPASIDSIVINNYDATKAKIDQIEADSCILLVYFDNFYGDSLALMKTTAHELSTPYEESTRYDTDFDPIEQGMVRTGAGTIHSQMAYTISNHVYTDAIRASSSYTPNISLALNDEYIDKDGNTYNNYGTYLMRKFYNSETKGCFGNDYRFVHEICPGFYLEHTGGQGCLGTIVMSQIIVYFTAKNNGTIKSYTSFAGTEEVMRRTNIKQDDNVIEELLADESCTYLKTPVGLFTELTLPMDKIIEGREGETTHENDTLNTVRLFLQRINDNKQTDYNLPVPNTLLLLPTDSLDNFFNNNQVADYRMSYLATYSSSTNGYTFGNISTLVSTTYAALKDTINSVIEARKAALGVTELSSDIAQSIKEEVTAKYTEDHPSWNQVMVIPVETTYSTLSSSSSVLTRVAFDMSLGNTRLVKGSQDSNNITVSVIYSKFNN